MQAYRILGTDAFGLTPELVIPRDSFNSTQIVNRVARAVTTAATIGVTRALPGAQ